MRGVLLLLTVVGAMFAGCIDESGPVQFEEGPCGAYQMLTCTFENDTLQLSGAYDGGWIAVYSEAKNLHLVDLQVRGLQVACHTQCDVLVERAAFTGSDRGALRFSHMVHGMPSLVGNVTLRDVQVEASGGGSIFIGEAGTRDTLSISGYTHVCYGAFDLGARISGFRRVEIERADISRCGAALVLDGVGDVSIQNSSLRSNSQALLVSQSPQGASTHIDAHNLTLEGNTHAVTASASAQGTLTMQASRVADNQFGLDAPRLEMAIRESDLVRNGGYALCGVLGSDASNNWWGTPTGPVVSPVRAESSALPTVCPGVTTAPHKLAP